MCPIARETLYIPPELGVGDNVPVEYHIIGIDTGEAEGGGVRAPGSCLLEDGEVSPIWGHCEMGGCRPSKMTWGGLAEATYIDSHNRLDREMTEP